MNERERIFCVLNKKKPDKTPWFADLSYLYNSMEVNGALSNKFKGEEGYLEFHKDIGAGICFYAPFPWASTYTDKIHLIVQENKNERISEYKTPLGSISCIEYYLSGTYSWAIKKHFVNTIEDLRIMTFIHEQTRYNQNYDNYLKIKNLWAHHGIATAMPKISSAPLQKLLARWAGVENTVNIYMDHSDEFETLLNKIDESEAAVFDILCGSTCEYVEFAENLSSEVTGATFFRKFNVPHYQKRNEQLHEAGKFTGIHIDGTLKPCLSMLSECGFDVAEAVTPFPLGDVKIKDLRKEAGKDLIIWGGLPGVLFSPLYTEEQFNSHLNELLEVFPPGSDFILGVADQVPPDGLISRIKHVRELIDRS